MAEYIDITQVERLPLNQVNDIIALDGTDVKRTYIQVDNTLSQSENPISSKAVDNAITEINEDVEEIRILAQKGVDDAAEAKSLIGDSITATDITTGTVNGTISVKGNDIPVKGLGSAAYSEESSFDSYGSADSVQRNVDTLSTKVNELETTINELSTNTVTITDFDSFKTENLSAINNVDTKAESALQQVSTKAESAYVDEQIGLIDESLSNYATIGYIDELIGDIDSILDQINGEVI